MEHKKTTLPKHKTQTNNKKKHKKTNHALTQTHKKSTAHNKNKNGPKNHPNSYKNAKQTNANKQTTKKQTATLYAKYDTSTT